MNTYSQAVETYNKLVYKYETLPDNLQDRLWMISKHWENLIIFYKFEGAPATNNKIENYYSTSLKGHQKKGYRSDDGIDNQITLSILKRAGRLICPDKPLFDIFIMFFPFRSSG